MPTELINCWWSWDPVCDIPNWVALIIEGSIIGGGLGFFFFWLQHRKNKKREKHALKKLASHIIGLENFNKHTGESVESYYNKNGTKEDFFNNLNNMKRFCKEIRYDLTIFSQDIDERIIDGFDILLSSIEGSLPFLEAQWRDEGFIQYNSYQIEEIKKIIDSHNKKYLNDARQMSNLLMNALVKASNELRKSQEHI